MEAGTRTISARSYFADMVDAGIEEWAETVDAEVYGHFGP